MTAAAVSELESFLATLPFTPDPFQLEACAALEAGQGVLVAAPTGAGKTLVGEFAVHLALARGKKAFYTTPIKALSNQKYAELVARHGAANVGLLTGDSSINGEAPVVVMTTEVLRNMMYAGSSTLLGLGWVVMDEVHYLADRFRGAVWEEVLIHLPESVALVCLSATVSNAEEFGDWLRIVRSGPSDPSLAADLAAEGGAPAGAELEAAQARTYGAGVQVIVSEERPVPLTQHVMIGRRFLDLFADPEIEKRDLASRVARLNPDVVQTLRQALARVREQRGGWQPRSRGKREFGSRGKGRARHTEAAADPRGQDRGRAADRRNDESFSGGQLGEGLTPSRLEVIRALRERDLLPVIYFIFSRAGCVGAVEQMLRADLRLIDAKTGEENRRVLNERVAGLADADLAVLGYFDVAEALSRGFAAHHAGMLPTFREVVEELFAAGRLKAVFATETLALGVNMPARTVVLEKLVKFNGESHADITPAEFTQLTGRAGRRGIDIEGHSVMLAPWQFDPVHVAGLASTRTYPLRSSFRPSYNMTVNLINDFGSERAATLLESSFAQYQADKSVVGLTRQIRENEVALAGYAEHLHCDRGDFSEYAALRAELTQAQKRGAAARSGAVIADAMDSLNAMAVGDLLVVPSGRFAGPAVIVSPGRAAARGTERGLPAVVTSEGQYRQLTLSDVPTPVAILGRINVPDRFSAKNAQARRKLAATVRASIRPEDADSKPRRRPLADPEQARIDEVRAAMRRHPCHSCPDRENHARWGERYHRLERETEALRRKVRGRVGSVGATFHRISELLAELGYLDLAADRVTPDGQRLRTLYTDKDLLAAECLRQKVWSRLDPPSLAAVISALIHEPRNEREQHDTRTPTADVADALTAMTEIAEGLADLERAAGLPESGMPNAGLAWSVHRWASGRSLDEVLRGTDLAAGDFVRRCKQIIDVLGQLKDQPDAALSRSARDAITAIRRGVVAADRLD